MDARHNAIVTILRPVLKHLCDVVVNLDKDSAHDADIPGHSQDDDDLDSESDEDDAEPEASGSSRRHKNTRPDLQFVTENADGSTTATSIVDSIEDGYSALDVVVTSLRSRPRDKTAAPTSTDARGTWDSACGEKIRKHGTRWNCFPYVVSTSGAIEPSTAEWTQAAIRAASEEGYKKSYASLHRDIVLCVWKFNYICYSRLYGMHARAQAPASSLLLRP